MESNNLSHTDTHTQTLTDRQTDKPCKSSFLSTHSFSQVFRVSAWSSGGFSPVLQVHFFLWLAFVPSIQYENFTGFLPLSSQILLKSMICKVKRTPFSKYLWGRSIFLCILSRAKANSKPGDERMMLYWFSACYLLHHCILCRKNRIILAQIRGSFLCVCVWKPTLGYLYSSYWIINEDQGLFGSEYKLTWVWVKYQGQQAFPASMVCFSISEEPTKQKQEEK